LDTKVMKMVRRHVSLSLALGVAFLGVIFPAGTAVASSGEIIQAEASPDWTTAHLAGWASWAGCGVPDPSGPPELFSEGPLTGPQTHAPCYWRPFVTIGPGSVEEDCEENERLPWANDEAVNVAWTGEEVSAAGTQSFDLPEVPLGEASDQLACLGFVETVYNTCAPTIGYACATWFSATHVGVLDSAALEAPEAIVDPKESEEPPTEPEAEEPELEDAGLEPSESKEPRGESTEAGKSPVESTIPAALPPQQSPEGKQMHRRCPRTKQWALHKGKAVCRHHHRYRRHGRSAQN
jgi:hypothetical protein